MKILWASNFSTQSGYSNQARLIVPRLVRMRHEVVVLELGGNGMTHIVDGIQVIPTSLDAFGHDLMAAHCEKLKIDAVVTLTDTWAFRPDVMSQVRWFPLTPVDHMPVPPGVVNALKGSVQPIAISKFGVDQLQRAGFQPMYLPHGVDPAIWRPVTMESARAAVNIPQEAFWVSFVGVNDAVPSRKGLPELLAAWSMFSPRHPDARLYLHTSREGNLPISHLGGVQLGELFKSFGIDESTVQLPDAYAYRTGIAASMLALIASASDVFVLPSRGEGFGLPALEFQRCGCPAILTDFAASSELCASGWLVDGECEWTWQNATNVKPSALSIVERLEEAYAERGNMRRRMQAIEFARQYDIDVIMQRHGAQLLESMADRVLMAA